MMARDRAGSPERHGTRRVVMVAVLAAAALMTACTAGPPLTPAGTPSAAPATAAPATVAPATVALPTPAPATATAAPSVCPNAHGGMCLGPLEAGTYTTRAFKTPLTYTVPDGWANYEDLPGNFLLVPPSGSLEGVDAGTSDYIGVYDGVAPFSGACQERPEPSVALTPDAMGAWYASHPGLVVEGPEPATIGGLGGVVLDLEMAEGETGVCRVPDFDEPLVPVLIGAGPAELAHALIEGLVMRLYLLSAPTGEVIAIEIDDLPGGDTMESMTQVAERMQFGAAEPAASSAALVPRPADETDAPLGYFEYLPPSYGGSPSPLLVFLHGLLESGDGTEAQLKRLLDDGGSIPYLIDNDQWPADRPFVVLAPQHPGPVTDERYAECFEGPLPGDCALPIQAESGHPEGDSICHRPAGVHEFIAYAVDAYDVDPDRVYLTGLSCGGFAAFEYAAEHGAGQIAAMVPIAGEGRPAWDRVGCALGDVPMWAFHGDADDEISPAGSIEPLTNLADCPSAEDHRLTIYPGGGHNSWTETYDLSAGNDMYTWLLGFTRP